MSKIENALPAGATFEFCDYQDNDGWANSIDNCPSVANPNQTVYVSGNEVGAACDVDMDDIDDAYDNCPSDSNQEQLDRNGNGVRDACDVQETLLPLFPKVCVAWQAAELDFIVTHAKLCSNDQDCFYQDGVVEGNGNEALQGLFVDRLSCYGQLTSIEVVAKEVKTIIDFTDVRLVGMFFYG
jgi:ferredoxin